MKDFIVTHPLTDRAVYSWQEDGTKVQIGTITCVTPMDWVMYSSDARWRFISRVEGIPSSKAGAMREAEEFVYGLFAGVDVPVAA